MTFIEFLILYLSISIAGGYYVGTNDNLAQPYKNSQNTYLKIIIKRNLNNESLESRFHKAKFGLRNRPSIFPIFPLPPISFINPVIYPIGFNKNEENKTILGEIPIHIKQSPSEYFLEDCEYVTKLPTSTLFYLSLGNYLSFPSVYLKPNQTLLVRMETINGDLDTESNGKEWSEIIATPSDLKEIQKCNFVNTQNEN
jgi:hypothetical protein